MINDCDFTVLWPVCFGRPAATLLTRLSSASPRTSSDHRPSFGEGVIHIPVVGLVGGDVDGSFLAEMNQFEVPGSIDYIGSENRFGICGGT